MTRGIYELETLRDDGAGNAIVITGAVVTVRKESDGMIASIHDAITGGNALSNPFNVTASTILFYADQEERYRITIETSTHTRDLRYQSVSVAVGSSAELDVGTTAGTVAAGDDARFGVMTTSATAGVDLGGQRVVVISSGNAVYADNTDSTHTNKVLGITTGAATNGQSVMIQSHGEMVEPSWTWTLNQPVFLSTNGLLTQTPPTTGFSQIVGFPTSATSLFINIREPLTLI